jgi:hypothetical protein
VFIAPQMALPKDWDVEINAIQFTRNDDIESDQFTLEILGSVGYFQFTSKKTGGYKLSGRYAAGIKEESLQETGDFEFTFEIENNNTP